MNKYFNASNSIFFLIGLFVLFNLFFIAPRLISMRLPADDLVANWQTLQYFFSYRLEFMKRGLIGTLFDIFNIQPTLRTIWILSFLASNVGMRVGEKRVVIAPYHIVHSKFNLNSLERFIIFIFELELSVIK